MWSTNFHSQARYVRILTGLLIYLGGLTVVFLNYKIFVCINVIIADKRKTKRSLDSENRYRGTKLT